jgi:hypothetical protein
VENGDRDRIGLVRPKRTGQRDKQAPLPEHPQKPASAERRHVDVHAFFRLDLGVLDENKLDKVRP